MVDGRVTDVVVVGSGAAGLSAALSASVEGADVVIVEAGPAPGGTTARSGGICWIPNNTLLRERGFQDPRADALKYMARTAYPDRYRVDDPTLGLDRNALELIEVYYDTATQAIDLLTELGAFSPSLELSAEGRAKGFSSFKWPDYYTIAEDACPVGRSIITLPRADTDSYSGMELVQQLLTVVERRNIPVLVNHRVTDTLVSEDGEVIGVYTPERRIGAPMIWAQRGRVGYWRRTTGRRQSGLTKPSRHSGVRAARADQGPGPKPTSKSELPSSWASPGVGGIHTHVRRRSPIPEYPVTV